jgi:hypothetical protein
MVAGFGSVMCCGHLERAWYIHPSTTRYNFCYKNMVKKVNLLLYTSLRHKGGEEVALASFLTSAGGW